jgi:type I restriction enzyme S subunit
VDFSDLQPITIHFDGSVDKRTVDVNREYSMDLWFARPGDIVVAKIDLKNGAVGIVPTDWKNVVVTGHFAVYEPDLLQLVPEYLQRVIQARFFKDHLWRNKVGAEGRKEVKLDFFEKELIPLPSLVEQEAIVARWRNAKDEIASARHRIDRRVKQVEGQFLARLGLSQAEVGRRGKVFTVQWQNFERWGVSFNQQDRSVLEPALGQFPVIRLSDVVADLENGWSPQCLNRPAELGEWGVLKLGAVSFGTFNENENKALPPALKPRFELEVKNGQVLISRANITRLVGACVFIEKVRPHLMLSDKIFRVVFRENSIIEPAYLAEVMKIPQLRVQIESAATGTSATMQNITKPSLLALRLPLPPLVVQRQMIAQSAAGRTEVALERGAVDRLTREIDTEMEAVILGNKKVS